MIRRLGIASLLAGGAAVIMVGVALGSSGGFGNSQQLMKTDTTVRNAQASVTSHAASGLRPTKLSLYRLGISAPILPMWVGTDGDLSVPTDVHTLGWWADGQAPTNKQGAVLIAGHVDSATQGAGALFHLGQARHGDLIVLTTASGRKFAYKVQSVQLSPKANLPINVVYQQTGAPRLVIVTCGGPFDPVTRHYRDNLIVTATPA